MSAVLEADGRPKKRGSELSASADERFCQHGVLPHDGGPCLVWSRCALRHCTVNPGP